MTATIISGKPLQQAIVSPSLADAAAIGVEPVVSLISVEGVDPMLAVNRQLHVQTLSAYGFICDTVVLPLGSSMEALSAVLEERNADDGVHGIMVLLPLPEHLSIREVLPRISPEKELEGLHPKHAASLVASNQSDPQAVLPLVGEAILVSLEHHGIPLENSNIVVLTEERLMRSNPVANMVVRCAAPAMLPPSSPLSLVPFDHPQAKTLAAAADLLIVSLERTHAVTAEWIKPGATVIDFNPSIVGFHQPQGTKPAVPVISGGLVTDDVATVAGHIMPIPGGVGPVMLGILMRNTAQAAVRSRRKATALVNI